MSDYGKKCKKCNTYSSGGFVLGVCSDCVGKSSLSLLGSENQQTNINLANPMFIIQPAPVPNKKQIAGKPPLSVNPIEALQEMANAFQHGTEKYGKDNWKTGFNYSHIIDATLRHIYAFSSGETNTKDSNVSHLGHALSNLAILAYMEAHKNGTDDR